LLGQFLSFFDGVKKRKISLLASTNDKGLVDKAGQRPGRFNFILDYGFLDNEQIIKVCNIHLAKEWQIDEVYEMLMSKIDGKQVKVTGAFIANLANNINEMSSDYDVWTLEDTLNLIKHSYKGFYASQISIEKSNMGYKL
jgi:ATP-dependent 26S proteasome regulatory subunit